MTDDFSAMMAANGVRRIAATPAPAPRSQPQPQRPKTPMHVPRGAVWAKHAEATATVTRALQRLERDMERRGGAIRGQIIVMAPGKGGVLVDEGDPTGIRTAADLIDHADARHAEIVMIIGETWKVIMHPGSGAATLTEDPV